MTPKKVLRDTAQEFYDEVADYERAVARILENYNGDPEGSHSLEDRLLERYIRDRAYEGDARAMALVVLLDADRTRWYA